MNIADKASIPRSILPNNSEFGMFKIKGFHVIKTKLAGIKANIDDKNVKIVHNFILRLFLTKRAVIAPINKNAIAIIKYSIFPRTIKSSSYSLVIKLTKFFFKKFYRFNLS